MDTLHSSFSDEVVLRRLTGDRQNSEPETIASEIGGLGRITAELNLRLAVLERLCLTRDTILVGNESTFAHYPKRFAVSAAHSWLGAPEFHALEYGKDGSPVRWTGPQQTFSFSFFVDRSKNARLQLDFVNFAFDFVRPGLLCYVDGQEAEISLSKRDGGYIATSLVQRRDVLGSTVVSFTSINMKSPHDSGSKDKRVLGLLFRKFDFESGVDTSL